MTLVISPTKEAVMLTADVLVDSGRAVDETGRARNKQRGTAYQCLR